MTAIPLCVCKEGPYYGAQKLGTPVRCERCGLITAEQYADICADAWDRGYASGFSNAMRRMSDEPLAPTTPNPYKKAKT